MNLQPFHLERIQSEWEHRVDINLSESGMKPIKLQELIQGCESEFHEVSLGYSQTNGTQELRNLIASDYKATSDDILATVGGAEANFLASWYCLNESAEKNELVLVVPNYIQMDGIWKALGGKVKIVFLNSDDEWSLDLEKLKSMVTPKTSAISFCNPNNPTGTFLSKDELKGIADISTDSNLWVISDEIYRGSEHSGQKTNSMYGMADKVLVTCSLSKVYALPGLRLGWIATPNSEIASDLWAYSDYTTIGPSSICDWLARIALQPSKREELESRARDIALRHWPIVDEWLGSRPHVFSYTLPKAGAYCFPRYDLEIDSVDLVYKIKDEQSVLLPPGDYFLMPKHLRIGYGYDKGKLIEGLRRVGHVIDKITS